MKNKNLLRIGLLIVVLAAFAYYFLQNRSEFDRIANLNLWQISFVVIGQSLVIISNILILILLIGLLNKKISFIDSSRLTAYSSLINFFGFLQGGLGFRGLYLKRHLHISLKQYSALTVLQYLALFGIAGLMIFLGVGLTTDDISTVLILSCAVVIVLLAGYLALRFARPSFVVNQFTRLKKAVVILQARPLILLFVLVIVQLAGSLLAYSTELLAIGAQPSLQGLLVYTGVSQFSIVIALTPGAIGIREGLLLLVQEQMQLSVQDIVVASTIDRVIYFITLALFAPLAIGAKSRLGLSGKGSDKD